MHQGKQENLFKRLKERVRKTAQAQSSTTKPFEGLFTTDLQLRICLQQ